MNVRMFFLCSVVLSVLSFGDGYVYGQSGIDRQTSVTKMRSNGPVSKEGTIAFSGAALIDGSKTPELIPDQMAFQLFFTAVSEPPGASEAQMARQRRKLFRVGLDAADLSAFSETLADFHVRRADHQRRYEGVLRLNRGPSSDYAALATELDGIVNTTKATLLQRLSLNGFAKLSEYVRNEKRNMRMLQ